MSTLTLIAFLPLVGAAIVTALPKERIKAIRWIVTGVAIVVFILTLIFNGSNQVGRYSAVFSTRSYFLILDTTTGEWKEYSFVPEETKVLKDGVFTRDSLKAK